MALLAFATFSPSLWGGFLYDDHYLILGNRSIRDLSQLGTVLLRDPARPLVSLSLALNYAVGGLAPWHYHLVNLVIHTANAVLVLWLLGWIARRLPGPGSPSVPLVGACLFALSPMAAETAAYVASRSTSLCALFMLLSLRAALPALEAGGRGRLAAGATAFTLALLTKEEALSLPLYLLLLDLWCLAGGRPRAVLSRWRRHLPFVVLPLLGVVARRLVVGSWLPEPAIEPWRYALTQLAAFPGYLLRALVPVDPALFRGVPPAPWPPDALTLALAGLGGALLTFAWWGRRRWMLPAFAVAWLAACLLPSSSIVPLQEMVVDHRAYLGSAGACLLLARVLWRPGLVPFAVALFVVLGARSVHYAWVLADPVRAWEDAVRRVPDSADAHVALGDALARLGSSQSLVHYQQALQLDRTHAEAWTNMGAYLVARGRLKQAEVAFRNAARFRPDDPRVHDNLGLVLKHLHRPAEAMLEFEAAVAAQPPLAQPRLNLAALLVQEGHFARARELVAEARMLELDEDDARLLEQVERVLRDAPAR